MNDRSLNEPSTCPEPGPRGACPVGGCGRGKGMCPGIALVIGLIVGTAISALTGLAWLNMPITVILALVLILGVYPTGGRWPTRRRNEIQKWNASASSN